MENFPFSLWSEGQLGPWGALIGLARREVLSDLPYPEWQAFPRDPGLLSGRFMRKVWSDRQSKVALFQGSMGSHGRFLSTGKDVSRFLS